MKIPQLATAVFFTVVAAQAQDVLHYDFRAGKGTTANNGARGAKAGPATGTLVGTNKAHWTVGKHDSALNGVDTFDYTAMKGSHNYLDTGWKGSLSGSFTIAFFVRRNLAIPQIGALYLFGGDDGFRGFMRGRARSGISVAGWGGDYIDLRQDIESLAAKGWVHLALVVDDAKLQGTWYIDGKAEPAQALFAKVAIKARQNGFRVGAHDRLSTPSFWAIDGFRLTNRALSELEIKAWTTRAQPYGKGCGGTLEVASGEPRLGKTLTLQLRDRPTVNSLLWIGFAIGPEFDLGTVTGRTEVDGCPFSALPTMSVFGRTAADGVARFPFALPNDAALLGLAFYNQAIAIDDKLEKMTSSNGYLFTVIPAS